MRFGTPAHLDSRLLNGQMAIDGEFRRGLGECACAGWVAEDILRPIELRTRQKTSELASTATSWLPQERSVIQCGWSTMGRAWRNCLWWIVSFIGTAEKLSGA